MPIGTSDGQTYEDSFDLQRSKAEMLLTGGMPADFTPPTAFEAAAIRTKQGVQSPARQRDINPDPERDANISRGIVDVFSDRVAGLVDLYKTPGDVIQGEKFAPKESNVLTEYDVMNEDAAQEQLLKRAGGLALDTLWAKTPFVEKKPLVATANYQELDGMLGDTLEQMRAHPDVMTKDYVKLMEHARSINDRMDVLHSERMREFNSISDETMEEIYRSLNDAARDRITRARDRISRGNLSYQTPRGWESVESGWSGSRGVANQRAMESALYNKAAKTTKDPVLEKIANVSTEAQHRFSIKDKETGADVGYINVGASDPSTIAVNLISTHAGPNSLGYTASKSILKQLKQLYPDATKITGFRVSGARTATGKGAANAKGNLKSENSSD